MLLSQTLFTGLAQRCKIMFSAKSELYQILREFICIKAYQNCYKTAITVKLLKSKVTLNTCENLNMTHETQLHLGNKSKVNKTCYSETYCPNLSTDIKKQNSTTLPKCNNTHANIVKEVLASTCPYNNFSRSRSHRKNLTHVKSRDREPSRIPVKKLVHLMSKNRKSRRVIKRFIIWTMVFYWKLKHS
jgi:hypothetical protein